jgi:endonuclease YncB( thermonuclease family)
MMAMQKFQLDGGVILNSKIINLIIAFFIFALAPFAYAQNIVGVVNYVADGDSFKIIANRQEIEIRLASIDAPEYNQNYGQQCRTELQSIILGKKITISPINKDRYGRIVANAYIGRIYINGYMVENGCAWAYRKYLHDPSLIGLEQKARREKIGLWSQKRTDIKPPWQVRGH